MKGHRIVGRERRAGFKGDARERLRFSTGLWLAMIAQA